MNSFASLQPCKLTLLQGATVVWAKGVEVFYVFGLGKIKQEI